VPNLTNLSVFSKGGKYPLSPSLFILFY